MNRYNPTLRLLTNQLNDLEFHSGSSLGQTLGVTRAAIWKAMQKLAEYGLNFNRNGQKGYQLLQPYHLLDQQILQEQLQSSAVFIDLYDSVISTSDCARLHLGRKTAALVCSEMQTGGRGRHHRPWHSPFATNIYCSLTHSFNKDISELTGLSLVISVAIVQALQNFLPEHGLKIKWPNDIVFVNHQGEISKLAGILLELVAESHGISHVVIGIGANVNMDNCNTSIDQPWSSLHQLTGQYFDRTKVLIALVRKVRQALENFERSGFSAFHQAWQALDCLIGQPISFQHNVSLIEGTARGINHLGQLLIELDNGEVRAFSSGDVQHCRLAMPCTAVDA